MVLLSASAHGTSLSSPKERVFVAVALGALKGVSDDVGASGVTGRERAG